MTIKALLFDFDGTIADTHDASLAIVNRLAPQFGYPRIDEEQLKILKRSHYLEVFKYLGISRFKLPCLVRQIKQELNREIADLEVYPGIDTVLNHLRHQHYFLGIVTSNSEANVLTFLQNNHLDHLFDLVHSGTTLLGKHKILKRVLRQHQLQTHEVVYVGDETRDIEAAKKSLIPIISVAWGFNAPELLAQYHPDFLIETPAELLQILQNLKQSPVKEGKL